jgi:peroxiredoxin Q/BCP
MIAHTHWLAALVITTALALSPGTRAAETPNAGNKVPLIAGKDQDGKVFKLADLIGKKIVLLYFYPKDDTPGCTKEACGLRDRMSDLKKDNVEVIGVSMDNEESHKKFIAKHNHWRLIGLTVDV